MKWFWAAIIACQTALLAAYIAWAATADYFVNMPATVSRGTSAATLIASRVVWLALAFSAFDLSIAAWIHGVRARSENNSAGLSFLVSIAMFIVACAMLVTFVVFSMPQY